MIDDHIWNKFKGDNALADSIIKLIEGIVPEKVKGSSQGLMTREAVGWNTFRAEMIGKIKGEDE